MLVATGSVPALMLKLERIVEYVAWGAELPGVPGEVSGGGSKLSAGRGAGAKRAL